MDVTVIIPTAGRPHMLRTALDSINRQSALRSVKNVIVIENLSDRRSEETCKLFPSLPLQYVFRDPPLPVGYESCKDACDRIQTELFAFLFDDDWWMPEHLENGIEALSTPINTVASYSGSVLLDNETTYTQSLYSTFHPWFASNEEIKCDRWYLELEDMLIANLFATSCHLTTLLARTDIWHRCLQRIADSNPYDTDRLLAIELTRHGKVAYTRRPTAYVRMHPGQESRRLGSTGEGSEWWQKSTDKLLELAQLHNIDLSTAITSRMKRKSISTNTLRLKSHFQTIDYLIKQNILQSDHIPQRLKLKTIPGRLYRSLTPPILQRWLEPFRNASKQIRATEGI